MDDAGWLDYESAVALAFAARRLEAEAVVVIVAARSVAGTPFAGFPARQIEGLSRSQAETQAPCAHPVPPVYGLQPHPYPVHDREGFNTL
jgi:hypothetical protein